MSRGLGVWQRRILDTLPKSREEEYGPGLAFYLGASKRWHRVHGLDVILERHVYDLNVVRGVLMRGVEISEPHRADMQQAISRAVRSLVAKGQLERLSLVPLEEYRSGSVYGEGPVWRVLHLADGTYLDYGKRQVRFVTRPSDGYG